LLELTINGKIPVGKLRDEKVTELYLSGLRYRAADGVIIASLLKVVAFFRRSMLKMSLLSFFMQVNKTLTKLDLCSNSLGPEGGVVLAKSLEVMMMICCFRRYGSLYDSQYYIVVVHAFFCAGEHKHHRTKPRIQPARRRGG
jgi:hypothetical protein